MIANKRMDALVEINFVTFLVVLAKILRLREGVQIFEKDKMPGTDTKWTLKLMKWTLKFIKWTLK